jgi:hypothetical protein
VPEDQLAQIHRNEMVLPAAEAQGVRNLIVNSQNAGTNTREKGGGDTFVVHAVDAPSVRRLLMDNAPSVAEAMRKHARMNGAPV